jgi:hypothetical protein
MSGPLAAFQQAMRRFVERIDRKHPKYNHALIWQLRLEENIQKAQVFGDPLHRQSERWEIIYEVNPLVMEVMGVTFNALCMFGDTSENRDSPGWEHLPDLSVVQQYIDTLWEVTRNACNIFNISNEADIWPLQCENLINGFSQCRKPTLPSDAAFVELEVTLAYLDEVVHALISLIDEFSPNGRKMTKQSTKQRGKIREYLHKLPQNIEIAIGTLANIFGGREAEGVSTDAQENTSASPEQVVQPEPSSSQVVQPEPSSSEEEYGETHPYAS